MAKRIVVTGGTGFIGRGLVAELARRGDAITVLSRHPDKASGRLPTSARVVAYDPYAEGSWFDELADTDVLVHLAGEPLGALRWTEKRKRIFEKSRVDTTDLLVRALATIEPSRRPKVFISASAVGYYGAHRENVDLDEMSPAGGDFLAGLCVRWEAAASKARELGVRVVHARIGVVLGEGGGVLEPMVRAFRLGVGGPVGSGEQVVSWVHWHDAVALLIRAIDDEAIDGPINITAPHPVTMNEFAEQLGKALKRPSWLRVPSLAVRAVFGEGAEPMLHGQKVLPKQAEKLGYEFRFPRIDAALADIFGGAS